MGPSSNPEVNSETLMFTRAEGSWSAGSVESAGSVYWLAQLTERKSMDEIKKFFKGCIVKTINNKH